MDLSSVVSEKEFSKNKMTKENCFNHLKKRFDDKSTEWQKSWNFLPETPSLTEDILEQLKLVVAMEEDISAKHVSSQELMKNQELKEKELQKISEKHEILEAEKRDWESLSEELVNKQEARSEKLKIEKMKIEAKKENANRDKGKHDIYGQRAKEYLGLRIVETTTDSTVLIFNNIDKCDVDREFLCEFALEGPDKRTYKVLKSEPELDDLQDLENTLNETNDLSGFVTKLRSKFQHHSLTNV